MSDESPCVAGYCRDCGGIRAVSVIDRNRGKAEAERFARSLMRDGLQVKVVTVKETREANWNCGKSEAIGCPLRSPEMFQLDLLATK